MESLHAWGGAQLGVLCMFLEDNNPNPPALYRSSNSAARSQPKPEQHIHGTHCIFLG